MTTAAAVEDIVCSEIKQRLLLLKYQISEEKCFQ